MPLPHLPLVGAARAKCVPCGTFNQVGQMKAICRVSKVKGAGSITGKSAHNYRLGEVPNADPQRAHLNKEYINAHMDLAPAIEARLQEVQIQRIRHDAVKGMEFILTASPERFPRDETGQVNQDIRNSQWVAENLRFMQEKYGKNLVAFTLHQDEKTPHIHAVVVPITPDGRLCAKELFNPKTLRQLQTDYAQAMKPFGLERGTEGSRARHVEMKQIYGLQQAERQQIEKEIRPDQSLKEPLAIDKPGIMDLANLERWKQQQEAKINQEFARRIAQMEKAAQKAQNAAVANATAKGEKKILQQKLNTSEGLKQANHDKAQQTAQKLATTQATLEKVAVLIDEKRLNPEWSQQTAQQVRARVLPQLERDIMQSVQGITTSDTSQAGQQLRQSLEKRGYQFSQTPEGKTSLVIEPKSGVQVNLTTDKFGGKSLRELVNQRVEQIKQEELKPKLGQGRSRGLDL